MEKKIGQCEPWFKSQTSRGELNEEPDSVTESKPARSIYLLTVEVQDLRVPGNLSDPGTFQGPGEAVVLLVEGSSMLFEVQQSPVLLLAISSSLGNRSLDTSLSWRLTCPSPLAREAPFKFTLT